MEWAVLDQSGHTIRNVHTGATTTVIVPAGQPAPQIFASGMEAAGIRALRRIEAEERDPRLREARRNEPVRIPFGLADYSLAELSRYANLGAVDEAHAAKINGVLFLERERQLAQRRYERGRANPGYDYDNTTMNALSRGPAGIGTYNPLGPTSEVISGTVVGGHGAVTARYITTINGEKYYYTFNPAKQIKKYTGKNTSTFFIESGGDRSFNTNLRLDYGPITKGGKPVWHVNVGGKFKEIFKVDHATSPRITAAGRAITIFKRAGKPLLAIGLVSSAIDVYYAEDRVREVTAKVGGFAGAWLGMKLGAVGGAKIGAGIMLVAGQCGPQAAAPEELVTVPAGGGVCGILGGLGGGIVGFFVGEEVTKTVYDKVLFPLEKEEWALCEDGDD